jgi:hypothetical protein
MSFVKVLSSLALAFTVHFAWAQEVRQVHLEGKLESRNGQTYLVYGQQSAKLNTALEDFLGLDVRIEGQIQNDLLVVETMLTRTTCLVRGKAGIGFYGIGSVESGIQNAKFHVFMEPERAEKLGVSDLNLILPSNLASFNVDFAVAVVSGVFKEKNLFVSPDRGFVARRYVADARPGDTVMFSAFLNETASGDLFFVNAMESLNVKHEVSGVFVPAAMKGKVTATLGGGPGMRDQISSERQVFSGQIQLNGNILITEVFAATAETLRMVASPVAVATWLDNNSHNLGIIRERRNRTGGALKSEAACENNVVAASTPTKVPFLRVVK